MAMDDRTSVRYARVIVGTMLAASVLLACARGGLANGDEPPPRKTGDSPAKSAELRTGGLRGTVVDGVTGKPAAGVMVTTQATKQSVGGRTDKLACRMTRTDDKGQYEFSSLPWLDYNLWAEADGRTCAALNSIPIEDAKIKPLDDLKLVEGSWLEGRVLTLSREPLSRDPTTGERLRIAVSGPSRPRTGSSFETFPVDDDGHFRVRVPPGRNFPYVLQAEVWQRIWRKELYERGIDVEAGETVAVNFRFLEKAPHTPGPPPRPPRDPVKLAPPVASEWDCAETIRDLGGWYQLDKDGHVVEINMVYHEGTGVRYDNKYTDSDEGLRIAPAFPRLKKLYLHKAQATDESLACLEDLSGLDTFFIWDAIAVTDAGAPHLAKLENIETIHLSNSPVGDPALEALSKLPKLRRISMQENAFTDAGLGHLAEMHQLSSLWIGLSKGKITDAGLAHLAGLENLVQLEVQRSQISDAGLEHLKGLKNLRVLILSSSPVTEVGRANLSEALPMLKITK